MKKILSIFIVAIMLVGTISFSALANGGSIIAIYDEAQLIGDESKAILTQRVVSIHNEYDYLITFVTEDGFATEGEFLAYKHDYSENYQKNTICENGAIFYIGIFEDTSYLSAVDYYGKHSENNKIYNDTLTETTNAEEISESYAEFFDLYTTVIENYLKNTGTAKVEPNVSETDDSQPDTSEQVKTDSDEVANDYLISGFNCIIDKPDLLTKEEEEKLFARMKEINQDFDFDITFYLIDEIISYEKMLDDLDWYNGVDVKRDGLIFGLNVDEYERAQATSTRGSGIPIVTEDALDLIVDKVVPILKDEDYYEALDTYLDCTIEFLEAAEDGEYYKKPTSFSDILIFIIIIPLVIALLIALGIMHGILIPQMKTAVIQTEAKNFISKEGLNLTVNQDIYTHSTESRRYDPPSSNSSGGTRSGSGGSRGGGGGRF